MTTALLKKIIISGTIEAKTGLMIGASQNGMTIGGTNREVIRNPISGEPYIPGSSLKGKMRSLFELAEGEFGKNVGNNEGVADAGPSNNPAHKAARLFGYIPKDESSEKSGKQDEQGRPYQRPSRPEGEERRDRGPRPERTPRPEGEARPPREPRPEGQDRPPREPRPEGESHEPRADGERRGNRGGRNRGGRGPRPEGSAAPATGDAPTTPAATE